MLSWLPEYFKNFLVSPELLLWSAVISVFLFVAGVLLAPIMLTMIPADYFCRPDHSHRWLSNLNPLLRFAILSLKNILGFLLVMAGLAMLVLPGQGLLTLLVGGALIDFPRKQELIQWILGKKSIYRPINKIRARYGRPPLLLKNLDRPKS